MIRVLVVDDHPIFRAGIAHLLTAQPDLELSAVVSDGAEVIDAVARHRPHVILMDLSMPGVDGIEATRRTVERFPDVKVLVLTSFADSDRVLRALDAGAIGYLLKDTEASELVAGVRAAARGESPMSVAAVQTLVLERQRRSADVHLSPREREVLRLVAEGLANRQISRRLAISESTVKAHMSHILAAIGADDRTQAAIWAHRNGLGEL